MTATRAFTSRIVIQHPSILIHSMAKQKAPVSIGRHDEGQGLSERGGYYTVPQQSTVWNDCMGSSHLHFLVIPRFWYQFGLDTLDDCERLGTARSPKLSKESVEGIRKPRMPA